MATTMDVKPERRPRLEVCQGPDCFGGGGGAALLEIEELIQEQQTNDGAPGVVFGGCRNFCSMGPNAHYFPSDDTMQRHYTKVCGVAACHSLVSDILRGDASHVQSPLLQLPLPSKLLIRRAERQRWQALRNMARIRQQQQQQQHSSVSESQKVLLEQTKCQLNEAMAMEVKVCASAVDDLTLVNRVQRRYDRLLSALQTITREMDDSSTSSSSTRDQS